MLLLATFLVHPSQVFARQANLKYLVQYFDAKEPVTVTQAELSLVLSGKRPVRYFEPDYKYQAALTPNDTYISKQWYLNKIHAKEAWSIRHDANNIVVAVLDSGVDTSHPDLKNNIWINQKEINGNDIDDDGNGFMDDINGWNFVDNNNDPTPQFKNGYTSDVLHGTIVAGIIGAEGNNNEGVVGIAWKVKLMPLKVLADDGSGSAGDVLRAIDYAIKNHADVINLSFVGKDYSQGIYEAIRRAHDAGILVVAAAGNNSLKTSDYSLDKKPLYPICMDGAYGENLVIGVAATDAIDQRAYFSAYGRNCIDISAPGISVFSTSVNRPYKMLDGQTLSNYYDGYWSGTSVAAPMVTGALVLIKAVNPELNSQEVLDVLLKNTDNIDPLNPSYVGQLGRGRLNIEASLIDAKMRQAEVENNIVLSTAKESSIVRTYTSAGKLQGQFFAFDKKFRGGVSLATGDVDGDRLPEIVVVPASAGGPQVKIFTLQGQLKKSFMVYEPGFHGGVNLQLVDFDRSGRMKIVVAPIKNRPPEVRVYNDDGKMETSFLAFDKKFMGGVNLTAYDINNDEKQELAVAPIYGGYSQIKFFQANGQYLRDAWPLGKKSHGGLALFTGDFSGRVYDREPSLVVVSLAGKKSEAMLFARSMSIKRVIPLIGRKLNSTNQIAVADFNRDGSAEIAYDGEQKKVQYVYLLNGTGQVLSSFKTFPNVLVHGLNITYLKK